MANKAILLRSVSAIATAAASTAGGQHAVAQDLSPGENGYYYSVQGGLMLSSAEQYLSRLDDKVGIDALPGSYTDSGGSGSGFDDMGGVNGSVSFGKQLDPSWDVRGTLSVVDGGSTSGWASREEYASGSSGFYSYEADEYARQEGTYRFGFTAADFEVGYTPILSDKFDVRLFAGVRALAFKSSFEGEIDASGHYSGRYYEDSSSWSWGSGRYEYEFDGTAKLEFTGIGPRAGVQASTRFEGTNFGLSGSLAGSILLGKQTVTASGYFSSSSYSASGNSNGSGGSGSAGVSGDVNATYEDNKAVLNVQASVGVDYYLNDGAALTIGYQGEKLVDFTGSSIQVMPEATIDKSIDTFTHGPFVKLSGTF